MLISSALVGAPIRSGGSGKQQGPAGRRLVLEGRLDVAALAYLWDAPHGGAPGGCPMLPNSVVLSAAVSAVRLMFADLGSGSGSRLVAGGRVLPDAVQLSDVVMSPPALLPAAHGMPGHPAPTLAVSLAKQGVVSVVVGAQRQLLARLSPVALMAHDDGSGNPISTPSASATTAFTSAAATASSDAPAAAAHAAAAGSAGPSGATAAPAAGATAPSAGDATASSPAGRSVQVASALFRAWGIHAADPTHPRACRHLFADVAVQRHEGYCLNPDTLEGLVQLAAATHACGAPQGPSSPTPTPSPASITAVRSLHVSLARPPACTHGSEAYGLAPGDGDRAVPSSFTPVTLGVPLQPLQPQGMEGAAVAAGGGLVCSMRAGALQPLQPQGMAGGLAALEVVLVALEGDASEAARAVVGAAAGGCVGGRGRGDIRVCRGVCVWGGGGGAAPKALGQ